MEKRKFDLSYHENSFFSKSIIRIVNYVVFVFLFLMLIAGDFLCERFEPMNAIHYIYFFSFLGLIIGCSVSSKIIRDTVFFEWDFTERKKKARFVSATYFSCNLLSILSLISLGILIFEINQVGIKYFLNSIPIFVIIIRFLSPIFFTINAFNCVNLFFDFIFKAELTPAYKIQSKPKNWKDDGKEIRDEDEMNEIIERDFGIHIDE